MQNHALIVGLAAGLSAGFLAAYACPLQAGPVSYPSLRQFGGDFTLTAQDGKRFSLHDARGKVVLIYFGFTSCADTCPVALAEVAAAMRKLGTLAEHVQPLFISVDPKRDTQEVLRGYLPHFDSSILGLTGTREQVQAVARKYRAPVYIGKSDETGFYQVDHSSKLYVVNTDGVLVNILSYGTSPARIVEVVRALLSVGSISVVTLADSETQAQASPRAPAALATALVNHDHHGHHSIDRDAGYVRSLHEYRIPDVALVDRDGNPVDLSAELKVDRPLMVNFIFTSCTAICPVLSATFAQVQKKLSVEDEVIRMVSISIDPEQDTPERLKVYAERYHASPRWHFLTGSRTNILKVQQAFDAYRGDKMSHVPLTFLRASPDAPWIRIEGFASAANLLSEYRSVASD